MQPTPTSRATGLDLTETTAAPVGPRDVAVQRGAVRAAPAEVVAHVGRLLTDAYERTRLTRWLVPHQPSRARLIRAWIDVTTEPAFRGGKVEMPSGHRAVAVWLAEPTPIPLDWWQRLAKATAPFAANFVTLHRLLADVAPTGEPYYRLAYAAVQAGIRGQGWGTHLLCQRLHALDARHLPAYAVALDPNNRRWLTRHGFAAHGPPILLPAHGTSASTMDHREPPPRIGLTLQPMWRTPAKPRRRGP